MKKTVVTTVRARPVLRGAFSGREGFISSRASITDFVNGKSREWGTWGTSSTRGATHGIHEQSRHPWRIELLQAGKTLGGLRGLCLRRTMEVEDSRRQRFRALRLHQ